MMEVARALSFQKPGLSESCLSFWILSSLLSTSKKPPYPGNAGPHVIYFFYSHKCANVNENRDVSLWPVNEFFFKMNRFSPRSVTFFPDPSYNIM
jgi:hypothetical protein